MYHLCVLYCRYLTSTSSLYSLYRVKIPQGSSTSKESVYSVEDVKLPYRKAVSSSARLDSSAKQCEMLYNVISRDKILLEDEEVILVGSVVKESSTKQIPVMLANRHSKTMKMLKGEKLKIVLNINTRTWVKYTEDPPYQNSETRITQDDIKVPNKYKEQVNTKQ